MAADEQKSGGMHRDGSSGAGTILLICFTTSTSDSREKIHST